MCGESMAGEEYDVTCKYLVSSRAGDQCPVCGENKYCKIVAGGGGNKQRMQPQVDHTNIFSIYPECDEMIRWW